MAGCGMRKNRDYLSAGAQNIVLRASIFWRNNYS